MQPRIPQQICSWVRTVRIIIIIIIIVNVYMAQALCRTHGPSKGILRAELLELCSDANIQCHYPRVASVTEEVKFSFYLILVNLNSHIGPVATVSGSLA